MKNMKNFLGYLFCLALIVFLSLKLFVSVQAAEHEVNQIEVDSWYELKEALESEEAFVVTVPKHVSLQCIYKVGEHKMEDYQISVKGEKVLNLYGTIEFQNSVTDETGLICLWDEDAKLTVRGTGSLWYVLDHYASGDSIYIEHGNLFYLSGGTLIIQDDVQIGVDSAWINVPNHEFHQAVFAGVRGNIIINGGMFVSNTIYSRGVNWEINDGVFNCSGTEEEDIHFEAGTAVLNGGTYLNGIKHGGGNVSFAPGCVYIAWNGDIHTTVKNGIAGFVYEEGFETQEPRMPEGQTEENLGTFTEGASMPIRFHMKNRGYRFTDWKFKFIDRLTILNDKSEVIYGEQTEDGPIEYDLARLPEGKYQIKEEAIIQKENEKIYSYANTFQVEIVPDTQVENILKYADVEEIMRPAPGATPDFDCRVVSGYTTLEEINWYPADRKTKQITGSAMSTSDVFEEDTMYCVEVELKAWNGYEFSLKNLNGYINSDKADIYFPEDAGMTKAVLCYWYDTAHCISEIEIQGVQYPLPGMKQNRYAVLETTGCQFILQDGYDLEWLYETNPGTAAAGFGHLDGVFKGDNRRHMVYGELQAEEGYWFATDNTGKPMVKGCVTGEDFAWTYTEDTMVDGSCSHLAFARIYELAQNTGSIFLGGIELKDGEYLEASAYKTTGIKPYDSYAYYKDNKLILHNYEKYCGHDYNGIDFYEPLNLVVEGDNYLETNNRGINASQELAISGDGHLVLDCGNGGILSSYSIRVNEAQLTISDKSTMGGILMFNGATDTLTINGGRIISYSKGYAIDSDEQLPIKVENGGILWLNGEAGAVYWEELAVNGGEVMVSEEYDANIGSDSFVHWDGTSRLNNYKAAWIETKADEPGEMPYVDVAKADWFYEAVYYNFLQKTMTGMDETHFGPYGQLSRAQFALILYRMEGMPLFTTEKHFGDIAGDEWYGPAVLWAAENGIVTGYQNGCFGPADMITREQMALMMYRYAGYLEKENGVRADISQFLDAGSVSGFATEAMQWANGNGIITGKEDGTKLDPQGNTARAEAAAIIQRFMQ